MLPQASAPSTSRACRATRHSARRHAASSLSTSPRRPPSLRRSVTFFPRSVTSAFFFFFFFFFLFFSLWRSALGQQHNSPACPQKVACQETGGAARLRAGGCRGRARPRVLRRHRLGRGAPNEDPAAESAHPGRCVYSLLNMYCLACGLHRCSHTHTHAHFLPTNKRTNDHRARRRV